MHKKGLVLITVVINERSTIKNIAAKIDFNC